MSRLIREAKPEDAKRIFELVCELADYEKLRDMVTGTAEDLANSLKAGHCWAYIIEVEHQIVGYSLGFRTYSTFLMRPGTWMEDLYVQPSHRGQGHGKAMLKFLEQQAKERGDGRLEWSVLDWNEPSIEFYKRMGADVLPDWRTCRISF